MMKLINFLFSGILMALLLIIFAVAIGYATFVENDYDPITARLLIYNARWFEIVLLLMVINFAGMIFTKRLYRKSKLNILLIHVALIVILLGAAHTHYFGFEGTMHIRNGQTSNILLTSDSYVNMDIQSGDDFQVVKEKVLLSSQKKELFKKKMEINDQPLAITLDQYYPYATKALQPDENGTPHIHVIVGGADGRHDIILAEGESTFLHSLGISFGKTTGKNYIQFTRRNDSLFVTTPFEIIENPEEGTVTVGGSTEKPIGLMELNSYRNTQFLVKEYYNKASIKYLPSDEMTSHSVVAARFLINNQEVFAEIGKPTQVEIDHAMISLFVGQMEAALPFALKLNEFRLERYPGSNSPSSFLSDIVLIDKDKGIEKPHQIFMNNILEYQGYRFYQSSYDQDEKGTVLSVNHDFWGTRITYIGYFLLFLSMILAFFTKHTRFRRTLQQIQETHDKRKQLMRASMILLLLGSPFAYASGQTVDKDHAREFGSVLVQGKDGRIMPINTLAGQLLIKIHKDDSYEGMEPEQVILDMMVYPQEWVSKPFVRINHEEVEYLLEINSQYAAYGDFFDERGQYKLGTAVRNSMNKAPALRNTYDKELIKVSERINLLHSLMQGTMLNIIPIPDDPDQIWTSPALFAEMAVDNPQWAGTIFEDYLSAVSEAITTGDYTVANLRLADLKSFQKTVGKAIIPSDTKISAEIFYNQANIFKRLFPVYFMLGVILVAFFFLEILKPSLRFDRISKILIALSALAFVLHTIGLALRWYIAGHAPWSNGYESMIYISWATVLAGFLFMKKSAITPGLTAMLAGITLLTAHMSWLDPDITNLVPVLKSYWLTIHVATITASYGFLGLAALLGFFNLLLMSFRNQKNLQRVNLMLKELTLIIELVLMCGLTLLIIGNFLGAIWANESWGRYWGWDPKETWTLVTIIFYSFVLHMNLVPGLKNYFTTNFLSLIGFSTILMTYFGVNFYLSGLHSYAGGDPIPIPSFVYYTLAVIMIVSASAWFNSYRVRDHVLEG